MSENGIPIGGTDFITAPSPHGFGMRYHAQPDGSVSGKVTLDSSRQGPPGHVHGGALIALLDEAMGASAWYQGYRVVAVNLEFDLKRGVPLNTEITVNGRVDDREGRKVWAIGEIILPDGTVAVEARGLFIEAPAIVGPENQDNPFLPLE